MPDAANTTPVVGRFPIDFLFKWEAFCRSHESTIRDELEAALRDYLSRTPPAWIEKPILYEGSLTPRRWPIDEELAEAIRARGDQTYRTLTGELMFAMELWMAKATKKEKK